MGAVGGGFTAGAVGLGFGVSHALAIISSTMPVAVLQNWIFRAESFMMERSSDDRE